MIPLFSAYTYLLLPLFIGYLIVNLICHKKPLPFLLSMALGYGLGTGILTHLVVLLNFFNISNSARNVNTLLVLLLAILLYLSYLKKIKIKIDIKSSGILSDPINWIFLAHILFFLSFIFWGSTHMPILSWDTFSTMGLKAKVIYFEQSLKYIPYMSKFDYPIHLPILLSWISSCLGYWDNILVKVFFPISSLCYLIIQYHVITHFVSKRWGLFSIVIMLSSNFFVYHSIIAYRDITMLYFNCTTILLIVLWNHLRDKPILFLAALFSGFTSFIKLEGIGYLGIHAALVFVLLIYNGDMNKRTKLLNLLSFILPALIIYGIYTIYKNVYVHPAVPQELIQPEHFDLKRVSLTLSSKTLSNIQVVSARYIQNLFLSGNWNLIWALLIISSLQMFKNKVNIEIKALLFALGAFFAIYFSSFVFTQHFLWVADKEHHVLSRSILHFLPIGVCLITLLNFSKKTNRP